jgi:hypothetical protein
MLIYTLLYNRLSLCSVKTIYEIITLEDMMCWSLNIFNMYLYWLLLVYFTFLNNELSHEKTILTFHFFLVMQFWLLNFILFLLCLCCPVVFSRFIYACLFCVCRKKMPARDVKKNDNLVSCSTRTYSFHRKCFVPCLNIESEKWSCPECVCHFYSTRSPNDSYCWYTKSHSLSLLGKSTGRDGEVSGLWNFWRN